MLNKEEKIVNLLRKGYNTSEVVAELKVKTPSVYYFAKKNKIKISKKYSGGKHDDYILKRIEEGVTQKAIAAELKVSPAYIQQRVKALAKEEARKLKLDAN